LTGRAEQKESTANTGTDVAGQPPGPKWGSKSGEILEDERALAVPDVKKAIWLVAVILTFSIDFLVFLGMQGLIHDAVRAAISPWLLNPVINCAHPYEPAHF
jgi:hypothetical protein